MLPSNGLVLYIYSSPLSPSPIVGAKLFRWLLFVDKLFYILPLQQPKFFQHHTLVLHEVLKSVDIIDTLQEEIHRKFEATTSLRAMIGSHRKSAHY
jgi:hypothetical protein